MPRMHILTAAELKAFDTPPLLNHTQRETFFRVSASLADHPEGLTAEQIRVYIAAKKSLRHTLHGMKRNGIVRTQGQG